MTVYQLFFMDGVPAYAAVNEAVAMTKKAEKSFVNAVLRSVQEQGLLVPEGDAPAQLAVRFSHPEWLVRMWTAHYGREQAMRILAADQKEHPAYGRINTLRNDPAIKEDSRVTMVEDDCFHYDGILSRTDWFREGKILIQDRSSQRVARQLDAPGLRPHLCLTGHTHGGQMRLGPFSPYSILSQCKVRNPRPGAAL